MQTLDSNSQTAPQSSILNTILLYGAYCGAAMVVFSLLSYLFDLDIMSMSGIVLLYVILFALGFTFAALAMRHQRDQLDGGLLSYGRGLLIGIGVVVIAMLISGIWNYILINLIDPGYVDHLKEQFLATWGENIPEDSLDQALAGFEKMGDPIETLKNSIIGGGFIGLIIGLITAAFMKREPLKDYMR